MTRLAAVLMLCLAAGPLTGCAESGVRKVDGRIQVRFWHSMSGTNSDALQRIADGFNSVQDMYDVQLIYQGGYSDSLKKLVSSFGTASMPTVIQLDDIQLQFMVDSQATVPAQDLIELDAAAAGADQGYPPPVDLADFEPRAIDYYTLNGKLQAMPFNLASPVLYYDRHAFRAAGLNPDDPPGTLDEVRAYSERLVTGSPEGSPIRAGISLAISAWVFEQMLARQGSTYANNGNGREARASAVTFDGPDGEAILDWWQRMVHDGLAKNTGMQGRDAIISLLSGESAMAIESTAAMRALVALGGGEPGDPRFGAAPLPAPFSEEGGMVLGGAAAWIMKDRPEAEIRGAWEFLKYATMPHIQAQWHTDTGYFPVRVSAWDMEPAATLHRDFPQFTVARDQVLASPRGVVTAGAVIGPFTQVREAVVEAFEQVLVGDKTPREALDAAAEQANRAIERYNRSVE